MKTAFKYVCTLMLLICGVAAMSSFLTDHSAGKPGFNFPYKQAGLTERQAAAHLLSRFTFGPTPGEVDKVVNMGLERWFMQQLDGNLPDDSVKQLLSSYDALKWSNEKIADTYPKNGSVIRMAVKDGLIDKDSVKSDKKEYRDMLYKYMVKKGLRPQQDLYRQFFNQKVLLATYSNNQLREVLTDFWFNHFNVSLTKNDCAEFIPGYERDVIRPNVTGKFGDMLLATAKSPAMLFYLDNFTSTGTNASMDANRKKYMAKLQEKAANDPKAQSALQNLQKGKQSQGLNENYAREVMELHTLGVDGGYTQKDVTQAARILTGWSVFPMGYYGKAQAGGMNKLISRFGESNLKQQGFVHDGDFLFTPARHDNGEKVVLGQHFGPGGGYEEGVALLSMLAHHPSTAKFITRKLAVRFVSDTPPQSLLDKMAKTFTDKDGDIREVLITMVTAPEFWNTSSVREKTKSPFELVISSVRSLNAEITQPYQLYSWANKMGQKMYAYQAPTGYPDRGQYWINTGALLNRMNFGLALASQRIPGVKIDLAALNNHHEPESPEAALLTYSKLVMPERNVTATVKQLTPMLNDPNLINKVNDAASKTASASTPDMSDMMMANDDGGKQGRRGKAQDGKETKKNFSQKKGYTAMTTTQGSNTMLSQVVGIIVGSPEFQRR